MLTLCLHCVCSLVCVQEQVEEMKKKEERMEKQMAEISAKNKLLAEPLLKAQEEVEELKKELANYDKDKETLRVRLALHNLYLVHDIIFYF